MNADRRASVLIGECTSDNGVHVHRNAISMCAPALPYVAACLTVAARPPERRRRSGAFGRRRERPPLPRGLIVPNFTPEWRLLEPRIDLQALGLYLDTVEEQLDFLRDQWRVQLNADLRAATEDESGWLQQESQIREAHVTRSLRGGFIISLWASYESGVSEVANLLEDAKRLARKFPKVSGKKVSGETWVDKAKTYFASVLEFPLHPDPDDWDRLQVLYAVRNTYAHGNGRLRLMGKHVRKTLKPVIDAGKGITYEWDGLHVDRPYVRRSYELVEPLMKDLISRALEWADREDRRPAEAAR